MLNVKDHRERKYAEDGKVLIEMRLIHAVNKHIHIHGMAMESSNTTFIIIIAILINFEHIQSKKRLLPLSE